MRKNETISAGMKLMELKVFRPARLRIFLAICAALPAAILALDSEFTSDPAHMDAKTEKPLPWPKGIVPFDLSKLSLEQA